MKIDKELFMAKTKQTQIDELNSKYETLKEKIDNLDTRVINLLKDEEKLKYYIQKIKDCVEGTLEEKENDKPSDIDYIDTLRQDTEQIVEQYETQIKLNKDMVQEYSESLLSLQNNIKNDKVAYEEIKSQLVEEYKIRQQEFQYSKDTLDDFLKDSVNHGLMGLYKENAKAANQGKWIWNVCSVLSLIAMIVLVSIFYPKNSDSNMDLMHAGVHALLMFPIVIGCVYISYICSKNAKIAEKIATENMHKWSVISTYTAYHEDYDETDNDFKNIMLDAVHRNPSDQINKLLSWTYPFNNKDVTNWLNIGKNQNNEKEDQ